MQNYKIATASGRKRKLEKLLFVAGFALTAGHWRGTYRVQPVHGGPYIDCHAESYIRLGEIDAHQVVAEAVRGFNEKGAA